MKTKISILVLTLITTATVSLADTLVLTNGRRVQGELIGVYGREIEFEERTGGNRRIVRVARSEIARIEFDNTSEPFFGSGNPGLGIPRGMREREVMVTAREPWTDTGIDVRAGQELYFSSTGEVRWGPNRRDGAGAKLETVQPVRIHSKSLPDLDFRRHLWSGEPPQPESVVSG